MELVFLALLFLLMVIALSSGFPVAFSLPGSAIITIGAGALFGYLFAGDVSAYFAQGGPIQWLSAGVTNFRSLYWDVERDTLIAIPLFVFKGIMLERSKIAEDLLVTMAQLFGPIPGGLGISVVFVGALLAATTGIVGATVIAMGLISLPVMLRHNYSKSLASGTICGAGTLGQIIPPSIVLIILADQLSNATDVADTYRAQQYREATGEMSMPSEFSVTSASAGDMFMGALIPGIVLVGLYMLYILISALLRPQTAPPVTYEGRYDFHFMWRVFLALVPPLVLIFAVLGSIIFGIATVNQAGSIGAVGALIMAGYRLHKGRKGAYVPAFVVLTSLIIIALVLNSFELNIKNVKGSRDVIGLIIATIGVTGLMTGIVWSAVRTYRTNEVLQGVMIETAKTTSMVFIILIGAAMLTSAFRGFGGEILVKDFLSGLPGGFWAQFIVVMAVIFVLGFFLDFIEISVVVVPIVAPILLADPGANITAVWLGVMIGLNIQTSFLTPPFGFALFYLRGVAPPSVKTLQIYKGVVAFILLQLVGLSVAGYFPSIVNYLPNRIYLTSANSPPPMNPKLQECLEGYVFSYYDKHQGDILAAVDSLAAIEVSYLPETYRKNLQTSQDNVKKTFKLVNDLQRAEVNLAQFEPEYRPLLKRVRRLQREIKLIDEDIEEFEQKKNRLTRSGEGTQIDIEDIDREVAVLIGDRMEFEEQIPETWQTSNQMYIDLSKRVKKARMTYRRNVDEAYDEIIKLQEIVDATPKLLNLESGLRDLEVVVRQESPEDAMRAIKIFESELGRVAGTSPIKSLVSKARRALKGNNPDSVKAQDFLTKAINRYIEETVWRKRSLVELAPALSQYDDALRSSIGLRLQDRLTFEQAKLVSSCKSHHKDISLAF